MPQILNLAGPGPYIKTCYTEPHKDFSEHIQPMFICRGAIIKSLGFGVIKTTCKFKEIVTVKMYVNKSRHNIFIGDIDDFITVVLTGSKFDPTVAHNDIDTFNTIRCDNVAAFELNWLHLKTFTKSIYG